MAPNEETIMKFLHIYEAEVCGKQLPNFGNKNARSRTLDVMGLEDSGVPECTQKANK
jgi:hypothetical protein